MHPDTAKYLTAAQVAQRMGCDKSTVCRQAAAGKLPYAIKVPGLRGSYLFDPHVIDQLATTN